MLLLCVPYVVEKKQCRYETRERSTSTSSTETLFFEEGDLVVRISYYKFAKEVEGGFRTYSLLDGQKRERMIHVSSLIRIQGLLFAPGPGGPAGRVNRREKERIYTTSCGTPITQLRLVIMSPSRSVSVGC